jgi:pimeloyl-ACP methyl ester carboxylesterase
MPFATTSDGSQIFWEQHGEAGEPLLCIMGLGGASHFWERQTPTFAKHHRTIVLDNRGTGRSDKPKGPYSIALMADDAIRVLDAAGHRRAHVLGISMGGMIAQELVLAHPDRVASLVLACTFARPDQHAEEVATQAAKETGAPSPLNLLKESANIDLSGVSSKDMFKFMMSLVCSPEFIAREKEFLRSLMQRTMDSGTQMEHFVAQFSAIMKHDASPRLKNLKTPTLVYTGDSDKLVPPKHSDELHQLIPGSKLVKVPGGTHGFNIEMPELFNQTVLDWFKAHPIG